MKLFLFNELIPNIVSDYEIIEALKKTILEYRYLKNKYIDNVDGIVSSTHLNGIYLSEHFTLANCLESIENKEIRDYSYDIFTKYPLDYHLDVDTVLEKGTEHHFMLDNIKRDALCIKIISNENGILFSLNLHPDLAENSLIISSSDSTNFSVDNLYGLTLNTEFIEEIIKKEEISKLGNLEKLKRILNNPVTSIKFENAFNKVSKTIQDLIIEGFETVIEYREKGINIPETLLKPVTHKKHTIFELKLRDPIAKRIYFKELGGKFILASLEDKPLKDRLTTEQSSHIKNAISILMKLTN
jgi:hypothetical protein